ncbi:cell division protein ZapC domain-containing protein [Paraglaciecola sp.]|uniref:cell division protein ZapC domain-containing protein n=1 Tax=Paraglaciecola sp. TaxID=1920173 RepID=UPI00273EDD2D|nr:cell division protein ZapC domain-containing protein [Paraglaciecola sp.]MDP5031102.1 cell division protein ZapC [Paraglaciecola sp.]
MLQPTTRWYWYCDNQHLMLSLHKNLQFKTAFNLRCLLNTPNCKQGFSLIDTERYVCLAEQLQSSHLKVNGAQLTQILINATAALAFHKPITLRSWYFAHQNNAGSIRQLASLENDAGKGTVLILEQTLEVATCMVVSPHLMLHANKQLRQFELIKVMKNRLIPYIEQTKHFSQSA